MPTEWTYEDTFRVHDIAVMNWLRGLTVDYGVIAGTARPTEPVLAMLAAPHQAIAALSDLLVSRGWIAGLTDAERRANAEKPDFATMPLPFVSVERRDPVVSTDLGSVPKTLRKIYFNQATGMWEIHPWPGHWITTYDITAWSLKRYTDNYIREWVMGQLGQLGKLDGEILLPVVHREPWGQMLQQFKITGISDLSELEGEKQRYLRTQFSFDLRTWVLKLPVTTAPPVLFPAFSVNDNGENPSPPTVSPNMFIQPFEEWEFEREWPVEGNATFVQAPGAFEATVATDDDAVLLADCACARDVHGAAVVEVSLTYQTPTASLALPATELQVEEVNADGTVTLCYRRDLVPTILEKRVHFWTVVSKPLFRPSIVGTVAGVARAVRLSAVSVRQPLTLDRLGASSTIDGGIVIDYVWTGLEPRPHLLVGYLRQGGVLTGVATAGNDTAPTLTRSQLVDPAVNIGFALLTQPLGTTLRLTVDKTLSLAAVFALPYGGYYHGDG